MPDSRNQVCPKVQPPTDREARRIIAEPMLRLSFAAGIDSLARDLGVNEKTVRRARDEETTLNAGTVFALFWRDRGFRETLLSYVNERPVPVNATCDTDVLASTAGAVHKIALATAENSPGGKAITDCEALECEPEIDAAMEALSALKARCIAIRKARAEA